MDRRHIDYRTQAEFAELDIAAIDRILNGLHRHRSLMDGQEVFAMQARAVFTRGRNRPPEPAPRPQPDNSKADDAAESSESGADAGTGSDSGHGSDSDTSNGPGAAGDPGAARSKREVRDAERRAARLADFSEIADALAAGEISTEQADLISRARVSTRVKLELLSSAKHQHGDETAAAVKAAIAEADIESADDRFDRQRRNRRGGCGVNEDGMYWLSLLADPVTGARIKARYDPRFRAAWAAEKQLDYPDRRHPRQLAGDIISNMLLNLPRSADLHPAAQNQTEPTDDFEPTGDFEPFGAPGQEPSEQRPPTSNRCGERSSAVRFVEVGPDPDDRESWVDLSPYPHRSPQSAPVSNPEMASASDVCGPEPSTSGGECGSCRKPSPPPSRSGGRPRYDMNIVIELSDLNDLEDRLAVGFTPDGVPVPASLVRTWMCDADISVWVEQADSRQLKLARTVRYATNTQRNGLLVRDGCCVWQHCTRPLSASDAHHITFYEHGGHTDLEQLCLLCPEHHRKVHAMGTHIWPTDTPRTWRLTRDSDSTTIKEWTNPPHRQKPGPRTNNTVRSNIGAA